MRVEHRLLSSSALGHDMEYRLYGHAGQPLLGFPSLNGRVGDWEGFGMVGALAPLLDAGRVLLVVTDGIDWQSWTNQGLAPADRGRRHEAFDRYLLDELLPVVRTESGRPNTWASGCSMGAYHAANLYFRHPDVVDGLIAISGLYQPRMFVGEAGDESVYLNAPLWYLPNLDDPWYLDRYRSGKIVFVIGQGRWEEECLADTREMQRVLEAKRIPATFDYWGYDVDHDWPWWQKMLPHWLEKLGV